MTDREKLIELMTDLYGGDPMHYGVKAYHIADHLIAHGVTFATDSKWIRVEDRLPKPEENPVLAVFYGIVNPAWCYGGKWELPSGLITDDVTHWMPLPEPPKED